MQSDTQAAITRLREHSERGEIAGDQNARDVRVVLQELDRLRWRKITPDDLPTTDCEIIRPHPSGSQDFRYCEVRRVRKDDLSYPDDWIGFTHFRPIAPPQPEEER